MGQGITSSQFYLYGRSNFTKTGYEAASKDFKEGDLDVDMTGKVFAVTGANSGIGYETSKYVASRGGTVYMICRNPGRAQKARDEIAAETKSEKLHLLLGDCGIEADIRRIFQELSEKEKKLDGLVCNAGALFNDLTFTKDGIEATFALHLLFGTYLLGKLCVPLLKASDDPRVVMVSSGGMYNNKFPSWEIATGQSGEYSGNMAYVYAKRGQVLLAEEWTKLYPDISFMSSHPGWADTPAVEEAYGDQKKFLEPMRTPYQGAEGILWLCARPRSELKSGEFYLDRTPQRKHLAGAFFTEGSRTKNTPGEVAVMMKKLEEWSEGGPPKSVFEGVGGGGKKGGLTLLLGDRDLDTKTKACAICSLSAKSNCKVCGRALCKACTLYQVMEGRACEPCHRQYLSVPPAPEPCVPDAFVEDIRAFCKVGPEWVEEKPVKDTKVWSRVMPGSGVKAFRYETDMECSVESLNQLLHEQLIERHVEWNATFLNGLMCEERGPDSNVQGWRFKTTGSDRDFCVARRRVVDEADGGVLLVERSVKHRKAPIVSGCIRADLPFNFRHFVKHEDSTDEKPKVRYTYANLTYVGGWISDWLLNKGNAGVSTEEMEHIEAVCSKK